MFDDVPLMNKERDDEWEKLTQRKDVASMFTDTKFGFPLNGGFYDLWCICWAKAWDKGFHEGYTHPQTKQEPVAWMTIDSNGEEDDIWYENPKGKLLEGWTYKPLYTTPQKRKPLTQDLNAPLTLNGVALYPRKPWVGLTDEEIKYIEETTTCLENESWLRNLTRNLEAKLKEKNT